MTSSPAPTSAPQLPRRPLAHPAPRVGALVGAALAAVATFLPWISLPDPFDPPARVVASGIGSTQGVAVLAASVVALVLVAIGGRSRLLWAVVPATLVVLVASGNLVDCLRPDPELGGLLGALLTGPDAEYGLWLALVGGVTTLACALLAGLTTRTAEPPAPLP